MTEQNNLNPNSTLGLMGGGQLGRMFAQAAATLGYHVCVLEPSKNSPAAEVALEQIEARYDDMVAVDLLATKVSAVTTEFENVPANSLAKLEETLPVCPPASAVAITQDRNKEKHFIEKIANVPVAPNKAILCQEDIDHLDPTLLPGILKTARLGYDGKGQVRVKTLEDLRQAWNDLGCPDCVLEKMLDLELEVSVIVCRNRHGETKTFPVSENFHKDGILATCILPARITPEVAQNARQYAEKIATALNYVGVLCIEFFVLSGNKLVVNELAPRPHNSGHATIDACVASQYEQQVRTMTGMPLADTTQHSPAIMLNILGDAWFDENDQQRDPDWKSVLEVPGAKLHLYGKAQARKARKMGHVTVLGATLEEAMNRAKVVAKILNLPEPR